MIKLLITILFLLASIFCSGQKYISKPLAYKSCKEFIFNKKNIDSTIYTINASELQSLIKCREKEFTLIYVFSPTCSSVKNRMIDVAKLLKEKQIDILFFSIDKDNSKSLNRFYEYFLNINYTYPLFVVSDKYSKNGDKKLKLFLKQITPHQDYKNVSRGSIILLDDKGDIIYFSDYTKKHPIKDVVQLINPE